MDRRLELHDRLLALCPNVYFQPPESIKLVYPCILYELSDVYTNYGNDRLYQHMKRYSVTVIDRNPDSNIYMQLLWTEQYVNFDRYFTSNGLNHWVLTLFY